MVLKKTFCYLPFSLRVTVFKLKRNGSTRSECMEKSTSLYKRIRVAKFNVNQALVKHDILLQNDEQLKQKDVISCKNKMNT